MKKNINGSIFGDLRNTLQRVFTTTFTKTFSHLGPFYGSGIRDAATNWVFTWLLLMDRLNTRSLLKRKKFKIEGDNYNCVLCVSQREETVFHLSFCTQMLATDWYSMATWVVVLPDDGDSQKWFQSWLLHGSFHYYNLADMETKKWAYLWKMPSKSKHVEKKF